MDKYKDKSIEELEGLLEANSNKRVELNQESKQIQAEIDSRILEVEISELQQKINALPKEKRSEMIQKLEG